MNIENLFYISIIAGVAALFWQHMGIHQNALNAAKKSCAKHGVTLLDQSIFLKGMKFGKFKKMTWLRIERTYEFEFSTLGDRRYKGWVFMSSKRILNIQLQPFAE